MRCSPKLCIALVIIGIGGAALLAASGYVKTASLVSFLPILACPLMCLAMIFFGRQSKDDPCCQTPKKQPTPFRESNHH